VLTTKFPENVDIKLKFAPTVVMKDGKEYLSIPSNKFKLVFETSRMYLRLDGLFNGNKALSDNMNLFLNENWQIILQELKPAVRNTLSQIVTSIISKFLDKVPYSAMFKDTDV
jgi:Haemolymph juvenile hormone binding protein (JHBP)